MECYDFELNISAYIDGELKQSDQKVFKEHSVNCMNCKTKLLHISSMIKKMPNLSELRTSVNFNEKLFAKIDKIENYRPSFFERLVKLRLFGLETVPALGFSLSICMIIASLYFLFNQDTLPNLNFDKLSNQIKVNKNSNFKPSVLPPNQNLPTIVDSDTSYKLDPKYLDQQIKLVGGK